MTPFHVASERGHNDVLEVLQKHGAKVQASSHCMELIYYELCLGDNEPICCVSSIRQLPSSLSIFKACYIISCTLHRILCQMSGLLFLINQFVNDQTMINSNSSILVIFKPWLATHPRVKDGSPGCFKENVYMYLTKFKTSNQQT